MQASHNPWRQVVWAALIGVGLGVITLPAREYYEDKEVWGTLLRVDERRQELTVDRGPEKKVFRVKWNRETRFRDTERPIPVSSVREGQRVRIYFSDDLRRTGNRQPLANKVIVNPVSTRQNPRYNQ